MNTPARKLLRYGIIGIAMLSYQPSHAEWKKLSGGIYSQLCPSHIGGDREYAGHGPNVTAGAFLFTTGGYKKLYLGLYMHQKETRSDWSEALLKVNYPLYQAPNGKRIAYIWNSRSSFVYYTDHDHSPEVFEPQDNLVNKFVIMGDTVGKDIGNCTYDDAYLSATIEPIWVWLE